MGPVALALLSAALFGVATPASKLLLRDLSAFQLSGLLYLGAALGMVPFIAAVRHRFVRPRGGLNLVRLAGAVFFGGCLGPVFLMLGLSAAAASSVALWLNLELIATALLGVLLFREHLDAGGWLGAGAMLLAGVLVVAGDGAGALVPALLVALACLCWGIDNHLTALIDGLTPQQSTFVKGCVAGAVNLGIGLLLGPGLPGTATVAAALALGAVSYGGSIALYITAAQGLGATRGQVIFASAPFFGMLLSIVLLGERPGWQLAAAVPLAALSLFLMRRSSHAHAHRHLPTEHLHRHRHDDGHHDHGHPDGAPAVAHVHLHAHDERSHVHPHVSDLHHRHGHGSRA